jgi:hypothetical protein
LRIRRLRIRLWLLRATPQRFPVVGIYDAAL